LYVSGQFLLKIYNGLIFLSKAGNTLLEKSIAAAVSRAWFPDCAYGTENMLLCGKFRMSSGFLGIDTTLSVC